MNVEDSFHLKDDFRLGPNFKKDYVVILTSNYIRYESKPAENDQKINLDDVIGAQVDDVGIESSRIRIISYPLKKKRFSRTVRRCRVEHVFSVTGKDSEADVLETAKKWVRCIKWLLVKDCDENLVTSHPENPQRQCFLILINPFGGQGSAENIFHQTIQPMLNDADVQYEKIMTKYKNHAQEIVQNLEDLKKFDCIVCCSGDGIVNEVINGLMQRTDWEDAIKTPLGHIPCGSGNGLCATTLHHSGEPFDLISSVFAIITGVEMPLDILKAETSKPLVHYSFLSIVFGIVADVDIESEKYRYMGEMRFTFMGIRKILAKHAFSGKLWYLPVENCDEDLTESHPQNSDVNLCDGSSTCQEDFCKRQPILRGELCETFPVTDGNNVVLGELSKEKKFNDQSNDFKMEDKKQEPKEWTNYCQASGSMNRDLPGFNETIPTSWEVIEGDFVGLLFISTSHIGRDVFAAPKATFGDGVIHCMCLHGDITRTQLLKVLLNLNTGEHVNVDNVDMCNARAVRLETYSSTSKIITMDGERFEWDRLQAEIYRGLARVRCRRPADSRNTNYTK